MKPRALRNGALSAVLVVDGRAPTIFLEGGGNIAFSCPSAGTEDAFSKLERAFSPSTTFVKAGMVLEKAGISMMSVTSSGKVQVTIP